MTLQNIIPSYLYGEYFYDENLQAFITAYNTLAQQYLNTFNQLDLPIYPTKSGALLDWVGQGIYGYPRPIIPVGETAIKGPLNTYKLNTLQLNKSTKAVNGAYYTATDDVYVRSLCWHFYKGDGQQFTIPWLKRRVARFLYGPGQSLNFTNFNFDVSYLNHISVTFSSSSYENTVTINITGTTPAYAPIFALLIRSGQLATPFQYTFNVTY